MVTSENAGRDPELPERYWRLFHTRGSGPDALVLATAVKRSWHIQPVMANATAALVGTSLAAGSDSNILFTFVQTKYTYYYCYYY